MLHGALDLAIDPAPLQAEFAALDRELPPEARHYFGATEGWTSIVLLERDLHASPQAMPALAMMPAVAALLARVDWKVRGCHLLRQAPRSLLPWHFDNQALHLDEARILIPIQVPAAATTWIGHEAVAYPPGHGWTGDFAIPHQVENPSAEQRVVLAIDVAVTSPVKQRFPAALAADLPQRGGVAQDCRNLLLAWRTTEG
ncbi:aspartyl/asparaginyl beta-hydroxylase domain-containing protein [Nitrospirillum iridis]|uniref:Aspartyl/asparaginy/proline hydroxylase domain-containing protein n=1 Tax=Nitrospirillum iridis TaxID=765888 RepID=A0A7X0AWI0_9PROT|nr:aspartyl/asparaginyl beta-hydroxylase domain-containing protein [Nitrospirillum iridis]MBB6251393.1 hypothetical protein [Nitrospirillum iridis]